MTMTRKELLKAAVAATAGGVAVSVFGCGDDESIATSASTAGPDPSSGPTSSTGSSTGGSSPTSTSASTGMGGGGGAGGAGGGCTESIVPNHGHTLTVTMAEVMAGVPRTYDIMGSAIHTHSVTITAAQFMTLQGGGMIMLTTTMGSMHTHDVTVTCA